MSINSYLGKMRTTAIAVVALAVVAVSAGAAGHSEEWAYSPDDSALAAQARSLDAGSLRVRSQFEMPAGVVRWTVVSYGASGEECLDVSGELLSTEAADSAKVGGCGDWDGPFIWSIGTVKIGSARYNVIFGERPVRGPASQASRSTITFADASPVTVPIENDGLFIAIISGAPLEVLKIELEREPGEPVASVTPPSLSEIREQKRASAGAEGGNSASGRCERLHERFEEKRATVEILTEKAGIPGGPGGEAVTGDERAQIDAAAQEEARAKSSLTASGC